MDRPLTHLSLFTGIGGLDIAAEMAGLQTVGQCEWADYPTKVLERHWPDLPRWRDIRTLTGEGFHAKTGLRTVDVISGGFPCQPFSLAGKRRGQEDDRYLWPEMLRVIEELKPTWVIGENVAGLVSMVKPGANVGVESRIINRQPDADFYEAVLSRQEDFLLLDLIGDLERIGYEVQPLIIPACAVGASHRRDRLALIAHSNEIRRDVRRLGGERVYRDAPRNEAGTGRKDVAYSGSIGLAQEGAEQQATGTAGGGENVADTKRNRRRQNCNQSNYDQERDCAAQKQAGRTELCEAGPSCLYVPDSNSSLSQDGVGDRDTTGSPGFANDGRRAAQPGLGGVVDGIPAWMDGYWLTEPDIPRIASDVPDRVDKLKALGNAVYWRQFYPVFAGIYLLETGRNINGD